MRKHILRIAILGATSEISRDLISRLRFNNSYALALYSRRPSELEKWLRVSSHLKIPSSYSLTEFNRTKQYDVILNFIGAGNPLILTQVGKSILEITYKYDQLVLDYLKEYPQCRYIFMSSGSIYGENFSRPVNSKSTLPTLSSLLQSNYWYQASKLSTEILHRELVDNAITDLRIFNYFSHTQSIQSQFLIANIARALVNRSILVVSPEPIIRDFLHPDDFCNLVVSIIEAPSKNQVVDCYSKAPISKHELLKSLQTQLGLQFNFNNMPLTTNPTGVKTHYYSKNKFAQTLGYEPKYSSLEGITLELKALLNRVK